MDNSTIRILLYALLSPIAAIARPLLAVATLVLILACAFYALVAPEVGFPFRLALGLALACSVLQACLGSAVRKLVP